MIIRQLRLQNFGIYSGEHEFDLTPHATSYFHRPVILFRGKNGVGKSTFVEAMRLCLLGSLSIGPRVSRQEYDDYLRRRIHRTKQGPVGDTAAVDLTFDYVDQGRKHTFRVVRRWRATDSRVDQELVVWDDNEKLEHWDSDQSDQFLRELVPPGILDIFFFDGERVQTLAENSEAANLLLSDTIRSLLGLDLVDQLSRDLDVYIARQQGHGQVAALQAQVEEIGVQTQAVEDELATLTPRRDGIEADLAQLRRQVAQHEQRLASQGGSYAAQRDTLLARASQLEAEIEDQKRVIHDLCGGLFPFAIAPKMLDAVAQRLEREAAYEQAIAARQLLEGKLTLLQERLSGDDYWAEIGIDAKPLARHALFEKLATDLRELASGPEMPENEVIHRVAPDARKTLLRWIDQARTDVPVTFVRAIAGLEQLQSEQATVTENLSRAPTVESIQPLVDELRSLSEGSGRRQGEMEALEQRIDSLMRRREQLEAERMRVHARIQEQESDVSRLHLAISTQKVLIDYQHQLAARKVQDLETHLVRHFNRLCRKETFLDRVVIDPETFQVTLYRLGREFSRRQLSAGENQLFAVATLWALREVSGRPVPVVIDTPLSRLDSEHRLSMIQDFFPHTSHQLIVLATDAEIDDEKLAYLRPAISHHYEMDYEPKSDSMMHIRHENGESSPTLIAAEEIAVS